jgi:hypothetical protein
MLAKLVRGHSAFTSFNAGIVGIHNEMLNQDEIRCRFEPDIHGFVTRTDKNDGAINIDKRIRISLSLLF